jgi:hypothetical protein
MSKYILTGKGKIYYISNDLETILNIYLDKIIDYIDIGVHITLKLVNINNLIEYFNDFIIQEYLEHFTIIKYIKLDFNSFIFITDTNIKISNYNSITNKLNILMKKFNIEKQTENIDIFIPLDDKINNDGKTIENTINTEFINKLEKENRTNDLDFIKKRIEELTQIRDSEYSKINELKTNINKKKEEINIEKTKTKSKKIKLKFEKEKWNELKRKFDININIYKSIKNEILTNERLENDIPELFQNEYIIFNQIYQENKLDDPDVFNIYLEYIKNIKNDQINNFNILFEAHNILISEDNNNSSDDYYIENSDQDCVITEQ